MSEQVYQPSEGSCIISEDVIATIASTAALEVNGVAGMGQRPADIRGFMGSAASKSVKVINNESETVVDVYVNVRLDAKVQEVGGEVQRAVKTAVQSMTGKPVTKVNVHIAGIVLEDKAQ
ncbi:MAG: Asp23/Gls24 family envelope stress response protein [Acutalibacteraceae bacterium]|jgi:uncharacterized alkaline shock family protein YloU